MIEESNSALTLGVSALVVIILILVVGFGFFIYSSLNTGLSSTSLGSIEQIPCPRQYYNGTAPLNVPAVYSSQHSSISICARLYYYNSRSESFNASSVVTAGVGGITSNETLYPPKTDFSVNASPSTITLGGPSNLNEGVFVVFTISTGSSSNGTYVIDFLAPLYPSMEICNEFTKLVVTNPNPFYAANPSCTTPLSNNHVLDSHGFVDGYLTVEVAGMSNTT